MSILLDRIAKYKETKFNELKENYNKLAEGQSPHTLIVTCADSRLSPQEFALAEAGELFVVRNAGNLVPAYDPENPSNEGLTIEYGVVALGIKELIVCGHRSCGAMAGLMNTENLSAVPLVQKALENYKKAYEKEVVQCSDLESLIAWNVKKQLEHLMTYPFIKERVESGDLDLRGAVYDFVEASVSSEIKVESDGKVS